MERFETVDELANADLDERTACRSDAVALFKKCQEQGFSWCCLFAAYTVLFPTILLNFFFITYLIYYHWASKGICVNAIAPGYMETKLTADVKETEVGKQHTARIPMGRWGKPEDLGGPVVFLASDASNYISGSVIPVDGGYLGR